MQLYNFFISQENSEYELKVKQLCDEAQRWKFQAEAGQNFTSQLVEKVKILEKYEEEAKHSATVSREHEKIESRLQVLKGNLLAFFVGGLLFYQKFKQL